MYTSIMKKEKNKDKPATVGDINRIVKNVVTKIVNNSEEKLALMMGKAFAEVHGKIDGVATKVDSLDVKLSGTNARIDDLAMNRVKYEDHNKLVTRVDKLERAIFKKKVQ
jgi:hypothetical protein